MYNLQHQRIICRVPCLLVRTYMDFRTVLIYQLKPKTGFGLRPIYKSKSKISSFFVDQNFRVIR